MKIMKLSILCSFLALILTPLIVHGMEDPSETIDLSENKRTFAVREAMIGDSIDQHKILTSQDINYGQLYHACNKIYSLYKNRVDFNKTGNLKDPACDNVMDSWLMKETINKGVQRLYTGMLPSTPIRTGREATERMTLGSLIKEDFLESMRVYEQIYGQPYFRSPCEKILYVCPKCSVI